MQEKANSDNQLDYKKIIEKVNIDSNIIEYKLNAYRNIIDCEFLKAKNSYEDYLKLTESSKDVYIKSDALLSLSMGHYLCGDFQECYLNLKLSFELISNLPRINKNKLLELKILSNLCLISLSLSNFKESMDYCNILAEIIKRESDKKFQKEGLKEIIQIFFQTDSINQFFLMNINMHNLNEKIIINNDLNTYPKNVDYKNKIMSKIIYFFHKFLKEDDIDSWIQCLNEESENFKLINESSGFLIAVFNMFLSMYSKNPNITEKAKSKILSVCKCIVNTKNESDLKPLEILLQECREKMRQASLIYKKIQNIELEVEASNTTLIMKKSREGNFYGNKNYISQNILAKIFLTHAKNYLTILKEENGYSLAPFKFEQMLNQINITLDLIKNKKLELFDLNVLDFDIDLAIAMKSLFENLLFIRYKFIVQKYFRKLMILSLGYDSLQMKIIKRQKKFDAFITRKFLEICEGKKEHFYMLLPDRGIRIYKKKPKEQIIINPPIDDPNGKTILLSDIQKFTYGISSENLRKRFKNMKNSNLRWPHLFFSVLTKKRSIDLYMDELSLVKWFYGVSYFLKQNNQQHKIISTSKFILTRLKLKMLINLKEYYEKNSGELKNNKYGKLLQDIVMDRNVQNISFTKILLLYLQITSID